MAVNINRGNGPYIVMPIAVPSGPQTAHGQLDGLYRETKKCQPQALATIQIMIAVLYVTLGTVLISTVSNFLAFNSYSGISFWGAVFYIISGSLFIAADYKPSTCKVQGALAMNIISSLVSLAAICLYCSDIKHYLYKYYDLCYYQCEEYYHYQVFIMNEIALVFLVLGSVLEFCVSISLSVFGCRSLKNPSTIPQVIVISNDRQISAASSRENIYQLS